MSSRCIPASGPCTDSRRHGAQARDLEPGLDPCVLPVAERMSRVREDSASAERDPGPRAVLVSAVDVSGGSAGPELCW